jgi:uncharacterized membrane protein HdeD (DUF308 family)
MEADMAAQDLRRRWALVTGLRGLLMLLAGLYAVIWPVQALVLVVTVGAILLIVDGALGLWSLTFGGAKTGNFWFDVARNALALLTGVLILLAPVLSAIFAATFFVYFFAVQAIIVGAMEITIAIRERALYAKIWPVLLSGVLYVVLGIVLFLWPLMGAQFGVTLAGVLTILFGVALLGLALRLWRGAVSSPGMEG